MGGESFLKALLLQNYLSFFQVVACTFIQERAAAEILQYTATCIRHCKANTGLVCFICYLYFFFSP